MGHLQLLAAVLGLTIVHLANSAKTITLTAVEDGEDGEFTFKEETFGDSPEETPGYFEGDIELPPNRNAIFLERQKWPNGIVYYEIHAVYNSLGKALIQQAIAELTNDVKHGTKQCIRFLPKSPRTVEYIEILPGKGCHSPVGRTFGKKGQVSIGRGCERIGTIMHELLHTLGFFHEQSRSDRDSFIEVHFNNINPKLAYNFGKLKSKSPLLTDTPYDFGSVMHYPPYAFAVDKSKPTITPRPNQSNGQRMGQRFRMSRWDVQRVQLLYKCAIDVDHIKGDNVKKMYVECTFEKDICNLIQHTSDDNFNWIRQQGGTPSSNTGPGADHTNGNGHYLYAEADGNIGKKAKIETPNIPAGPSCISFVFYNYGTAHGHFSIYLGGKAYQNKKFATLDKYATYKQWINFKVNVVPKYDFTLIMESSVGTGSTSDVAIDDLEVYAGKCV